MSSPSGSPVQRAIVGFHCDEAGDWVAELNCGHYQHVRHNPPWRNRPWTQTEAGRAGMLGASLRCLKCERNEAADTPPNTASERFQRD